MKTDLVLTSIMLFLYLILGLIILDLNSRLREMETEHKLMKTLILNKIGDK